MLKTKNWIKVLLAFLMIILVVCCKPSDQTLFKELPSKSTHIDFNNRIIETDTFNILTNEYIFNGGGVAAADFNNDGLTDLYFTGNQVENRLYLNKGDLIFDDITERSQTAAVDNWSTGVVVADVNSDGWLDMYVCTAMNTNQRENLLYLNQGLDNEGVPYFKEQGDRFKVASTSNSMAAAFFDYNKDGLLDLYVVNNEQTEMNPNKYRKKIVDGSAPSTDQLFRNNGDGTFTDVSKEAGIQIEGYGLSVTISDFNKDHWPDIYVANDYLSNDILYINQKDGTFLDQISEYISHQSRFSMGSDAADFNNDGYTDLITLDMLGETHQRKKTTISGYSYTQDDLNKKWNYEDQYIRNMLFMGNNDSKSYAEIGRMAGIYQTDWSWSPLFADFDNDGLKDLLVTNGFPRDITDMDFANYRLQVQRYLSEEKLLDSIPIVKIENYSFKNNGDLTFQNVNKSWGLNSKSFSNGAIYSDLDADGDLDYVVNNINDKAFIFENKASNKQNNFIQFKLNGNKGNPQAIGSKTVIRFTDGSFQFHELYLSKGYMSSVDPLIHFGLGSHKNISRVEVLWPDGNYTSITDLTVNQLYEIHHKNSNKVAIEKLEFPLVNKEVPTEFKEVSAEYDIDYIHAEEPLNDFAYHPLLLRKISENGPTIAVGDLNGDQLEDFIVGSSFGTSPVIFFQTKDSKFVKTNLFDQEEMLEYEVESIALFDLENDGDLDLYLVSGGGYFNKEKTNLEDRLFLNDGLGSFTQKKLENSIQANGSIAVTNDFDEDGYVDLFVGARNIPGQYPLADKSYFLKNNKGNLEVQNITELGLVSDAKWIDIDNDQSKELIVVGEFSSIQIFKKINQVFEKLENEYLNNIRGLWRCIETVDFDFDGDMDLIVGNLGANNMYNIDPKTPLEIVVKDVDNNGANEAVIFTYQKNKDNKMEQYPFNFWSNLYQQSPFFRQKFSTYREFSKAVKGDYLKEEAFKNAQKFHVNEDRSILIENLGEGKFSHQALAIDVQLAPVNAIHAQKIDSTNFRLFLVGNDFGGNPFEGNDDAFGGLVLNGDAFQLIKNNGFNVKGVGSEIKQIKLQNGNSLILVAQNKDQLLVYQEK
jgi:hypothetical protein